MPRRTESDKANKAKITAGPKDGGYFRGPRAVDREEGKIAGGKVKLGEDVIEG